LKYGKTIGGTRFAPSFGRRSQLSQRFFLVVLPLVAVLISSSMGWIYCLGLPVKWLEWLIRAPLLRTLAIQAGLATAILVGPRLLRRVFAGLAVLICSFGMIFHVTGYLFAGFGMPLQRHEVAQPGDSPKVIEQRYQESISREALAVEQHRRLRLLCIVSVIGISVLPAAAWSFKEGRDRPRA